MKIGNTIHFFDQLDSTNAYIARLIAKTDPEHGLVIVADYQTGGKGQFGRKWTSNKGENLLLSIFLKPGQLVIGHIALLHFVVSIAIAKTMEHFLMNRKYVQIKWPNDILINQKKVGGVLITNTIGQSEVRHSIVGIGLNVLQTEFDEEFAKRTTSMLIEEAMEAQRHNVLNRLMDELNATYALLDYPEELKRQYIKRLFAYQEWRLYELNSTGEVIRAKIIDVYYDGSVELELQEMGKRILTKPGEVKLLY